MSLSRKSHTAGGNECWSSHHSASRVRMSATELVCAAPSQQRLRRSSVAAARYNLALNWSSSSCPSSRCYWHSTSRGRDGASRGGASCAQHQLRRKSISSVAAAEAGDGSDSVPRRP